jgi:putative DNA primase/helicase
MTIPTGKFSEMTKEESLAVCAKERHEQRKQKKQPTAILKTFSQIEEKPLEWLWQDHFPLSMFTIIAGDAGLGKSTISLDISARLSRGLPFPDKSTSMIGDSLILAGEDDPAYTIKPRLQALGADMNRIHILMGKREEHGEDDFSVMDTGVIKDAIDQIRAQGGNLKLVIVDPLESFIGGTVDTYRNNEVRMALKGLIALAQKEQFTVIAIQHLTKKTGITANYRISGSVAFGAAARTVWLVSKDPENSRNCLFLNSKMNIAPKNEGYRYNIESIDGIGVPAWGERVNTDPDDVLNMPPAPKTAPSQDKVLEIIREKHPSAIKAKEIQELAGMSPQQVSNILKELENKGAIKKSTGLYGYYQLTLSHTSPIGNSSESVSLPQVSQELTKGVKVESESKKKLEELEIY